MSGEGDPLAALRDRFRSRCAEDLALVQRGLDDPAFRTDPQLKQSIHRLSGMAGMFGYVELGGLAHDIDDDWQFGRPPPPERLQSLADALKAAL